MFRLLILFSFFITTLFAQVDANLEIVKKANTIPKIVVSVSSDTNEISTLSRIKEVVSKDFIVSGHFDVVSSDLAAVSYNDIPDIIRLSNAGVDLYLNLSAQRNDNGSYTLFTKLYDVNSQSMVLEKKLYNYERE